MEGSQRKKPGLPPAAICAQQYDREHVTHHDARVEQPGVGTPEKDDKGRAECRYGRKQSGLDQPALMARYGAVGKNEAHRRENFESGEVSFAEAQNNWTERAP